MHQRRVALPDALAVRGYVGLHRPGFRIYVIETRGLVMDSRVLSDDHAATCRTSTQTAHICVPLIGDYVVRRDRERLIAPGEALVEPSVSFDERWSGRRFLAFCVEWGPAFGASPTEVEIGHIGSTDLARIRTFSEALIRGVVQADALHEVLELLISHGILQPGVRTKILEPAPPGAHELAAAVSESFCRLDTHPDLSDLQRRFGFGPRTLHRMFDSAGEWSALAPHGWRRRLRVLRTKLAPSLSTARGATVEGVARALGYRSARALLLALRQDSVPPPSTVRELVLGGRALTPR